VFCFNSPIRKDTMKTVYPDLREILSDNASMRFMLKRRRISTVVELQLFTHRMIEMESGLGLHVARYINSALQQHGLSLRPLSESIIDTVVGTYGSVYQAPVEVLNFKVAGGDTQYRHIRSLDDVVGQETVEDTVLRIRRSRQHSIEFDAIIERLLEWGIKV